MPKFKSKIRSDREIPTVKLLPIEGTLLHGSKLTTELLLFFTFTFTFCTTSGV